MVRDVEPAENYLKDMLQQLNTLMATKPSEKATICQGDSTPLTLVDMFFVVKSLYIHLFVIYICRRSRRSCMCSYLLDQQVGGLL